ncbi:Fe-Mn family superoxide dismutase [Dysgonomonadaceae bacterium PH5-43]|nr:Fe-Mn family superoxide dismutase [Dysgonomonadaceae bacterium PH5-43]
MKFEMPILPYAYNALEPIISKETIEFHWGKHVNAYLTNLNNLVDGTKFENATLEEIVKNSDGGIYNNAAQVWNHVFYFNSFSANRRSTPSKELLDAITESFGGFEEFKKEFEKQATSIFGSGWMWLVKDDKNKLSLIKASNAENPIRNNLMPIFVADVWEHAYYLDYQNKRPQHLSLLWEIVDWNIISDRYKNYKAIELEKL